VLFLILLGIVVAAVWGLALGWALRHDTQGRRLIRELEAWRRTESV
jgi:hypothetical protein